MKKTIPKITLTSLLAAAMIGAPLLALGRTTPRAKPVAERKGVSKAEKRNGPIPFHGKIVAIDKDARTLRVGERTFIVAPETRINKNGKPALLGDAAVGDDVGGNYQVAEGGKLEVLTMHFSPHPEGKTKAVAKPKRKGDSRNTAMGKEQ